MLETWEHDFCEREQKVLLNYMSMWVVDIMNVTWNDVEYFIISYN